MKCTGERDRRKLFEAVNGLVLILVFTAAVLKLLALGIVRPPWPGLTISVILAANAFYVQRGGSLTMATWVLIVTLLIGLAVSSFYTGAFNGPIIYLAPILPLLAAVLIGGLMGWIAFGLTLLTLSILSLLQYYGLTTAVLLGETGILVGRFIAVFSTCLVTTWVVWDFCRKSAELQRVSEKSKDLENAKSKAEAAVSAKNRFLANMSHEIRTPMNGLLGMAELIDGNNLTVEQKSHLKTLQSSGQVLLTIINDILDLSKIDEGKLQFENKVFHLRDWIDNLVTPYRLQNKGSVEFVVRIDSKVPAYIKGDAIRLQQTVGNLLSNSFKFTQQGAITLEVKVLSRLEKKVDLQFKVTDTGIGMNNETLSRIFNAFEQGDLTTTRKFGGTGLGLSICKELVSLAGGNIWADSTEGKGATFYVEMPFGEALKPVEKTSEEVAAGLPSLNILLVDDSLINQTVATAMLKELGMSCNLAEDGKVAVDLIKSGEYHFDIILMDCEMPVMNGYDATRAIREWERKNDAPRQAICAFTAHAMEDQEQYCKKAGMDLYLTKPLRMSSLEEFLYRFVGLKQNEPIMETTNWLAT